MPGGEEDPVMWLTLVPPRVDESRVRTGMCDHYKYTTISFTAAFQPTWVGQPQHNLPVGDRYRLSGNDMCQWNTSSKIPPTENQHVIITSVGPLHFYTVAYGAMQVILL